MMAPDEYLAGQAKRFRELRLSLGYETHEDFAAAIGYDPNRYFRYEHLGIVRTSALRRLVKAVESSGHDPVSYDGLLSLEAAKCCGRVYHRPGRWRETAQEVRS